MHPETGTAEAIDITRRAGHKLVIAGIVQDQAYLECAVAPHLDGDQVCYIGAVGPDKRSDVLGGAGALLQLYCR